MRRRWGTWGVGEMMGKEDKSEIGLLSEIGSLSKNK